MHRSLCDAAPVWCNPSPLCSKLHVVYDDAESSLLDQERDDFMYTSLPVSHLTAAQAAAAVEEAVQRSRAPQRGEAKKGRRLMVFWPDSTGNDGAWYKGTITHVLRNG